MRPPQALPKVPTGKQKAPPQSTARTQAPETVRETETDDDHLDALAQEYELPSVDSLDAESDFKPFMQVGIPDALKQAAMRRLWRIDKSFGFLDGMNDYDEDFNITDKLITLLDTNYKVGKGFLDEDETDEEEEIISENENDKNSETEKESLKTDEPSDNSDRVDADDSSLNDTQEDEV